jgi:hypothetical protein
MTPALKVGDTIKVAEPDYCYGVGELHLSGTKIGPVEQLADGQWVSLDGVKLRPDGSVYEPTPRHALVRVRGIKKRRAHDHHLPEPCRR